MDSVERGRIAWASRRGMLELDLILGPFVKNCYAELSCAERADYRLLLERPDPQLHAWLTGRAQPRDARLASMVARIRASLR